MVIRWHEMVAVGGRPAIKLYGSGDFGAPISIPLTEAANNYTRGQMLIAGAIMPFIPTGFASSLVPLMFRGDYRAESLAVAPATEAPIFRFNVGSVQFVAERHAIKGVLDIEMEKDSGDAWLLREQMTVGLASLLNASLEKLSLDAAFSSSNVSSTWKVGSAWTGAGNAMTSVLGLLDGVQGASGFRPDFVSFGASAWSSFAANSAALARCGGRITPSRVAEVLRVSSVVVHDGQYNSGPDVPPVFAPFQPADSILAAHTRAPAWAVRPFYTLPGVPNGPFYTEVYPYEKIRSTYVEVGVWMAQVIADPNLAGTLSGVNSSQSGGI